MKKDIFFGGGSVLGIIGFINSLLDLLSKPSISEISKLISVFILGCAVVMFVIWFVRCFIVKVYEDQIKTLTRTHKDIDGRHKELDDRYRRYQDMTDTTKQYERPNLPSSTMEDEIK